MTISSILHEYIISSPLKPLTRDSYSSIASLYIIPAIGDREPNELSAAAITQLLDSASDHPRSKELIYILLHAALPDLSIWHSIKRPKYVRPPRVPLTDAELTRYAAEALKCKHALPLMLAATMGLRRGEICGARYSDIKLLGSYSVLYVCNQRVRVAGRGVIDQTPKSATSIRAVPLSSVVSDLLPRDASARVGYLTNLTPSGLDQVHRRVIQAAGLPPVTLHDMRHTMATIALDHGASLPALKAILGHSSIAITADIYLHPSISMLASSVAFASRICYNGDMST